MANTKPLTLSELNAFLARLRATVETAERFVELQSQLENVKSIGISASRPGARRNGVSTKKAKRGSRRKNSPAAAAKLRDRIVSYLSARKKGAVLKDVARSIGADVEAVRYGLNSLRASRKVRMTGQRSGARWHAAG